MSAERRSEKDKKEEKDEKGEGMEEKWRRDPLSAIFFGLLLVVVGLFLLLASMDVISWSQWWAFLLLGIGAILIIEALVRYAMPAYRRPMFVRVLIGLILVSIGAGHIAGLEEWWALVVVVVGVAILGYGIQRAIRPRE